MIVLLLSLLIIICCCWFKRRIFNWLDQVRNSIFSWINGPVISPIEQYDKHTSYYNWVYFYRDDAAIKHLSWHEGTVFSNSEPLTASLV